jgi:hypothetical protein
LLAADFSEVVEMDLNPIFAYPEGTAPVAVDVRDSEVVVRGPGRVS